MRQQDKMILFHCDGCDKVIGGGVVALNDDSPTLPDGASGWSTLRVKRKPSSWKHYCPVCWNTEQPAKLKFIQDWNDCVGRGLYLSEELAQGYYHFFRGWHDAKTQGLRMTEPHTGMEFNSPGNYQARVRLALANQWEMKSDLVGAWNGADVGVTERTQVPHPDGYVESAQFDVQLPRPLSMQEMNNDILMERMKESPEYQRAIRFKALFDQMTDLFNEGN